MLSKAQWNDTAHLPGELWSIEKIYQIHQNVTENGIPATSENIKGCTDKLLFNSVPICNFAIPILHIIIGIGNSLVDCIFEWIEEHIKKLTPDQIQAWNSFLFAKVQYDRLKEDYDEWLQNDGILLVDKQLNKSFLKEAYSKKVRVSEKKYLNQINIYLTIVFRYVYCSS